MKSRRLIEGTPAKNILEKEQTHTISFALHPDANPKSRQQGLLRWQKNPEKEWGPKPRAKKSGTSQTMVESRIEKQGKRKAKQVMFYHHVGTYIYVFHVLYLKKIILSNVCILYCLVLLNSVLFKPCLFRPIYSIKIY